MKKFENFLKQKAEEAGFSAFCSFNAKLLKIDPTIISFCKEDKCGNYKKNYMCPPFQKYLDLNKFKTGYLFQTTSKKNNWKSSKINFHLKMLEIEKDLQIKFPQIFYELFIAGSCELCNPCYAVLNKPCAYPEKAKPSLEAVGINVIELLKKLKLPSSFNDNTITWSAFILT